MASEVKNSSESTRPGVLSELQAAWAATPNRVAVVVLLAAWIMAFQWFGNSTLGYVDTSSLFGWWLWTMKNTPDEEHAYLIPFVVVALLWARREEFLKLEKRTWMPAVVIVVASVLLHLAGYMVQQTRLSIIAFFLGIYGIVGMMVGRSWMAMALFPFALFVFCIPLGSTNTELVSFPLRLMATKITAGFSDWVLGIKVVHSGTQLMDAGGTYQYEVAAACSGIRSLTAIVAFSVVYAYLAFKTTWRRALIIASAFPLAVVANVFRLTLIVIAAEAFGQDAGNYVHESSIFSMAPYIPSIGGMLLLGWWLSEERRNRKRVEPVILGGVEQNS